MRKLDRLIARITITCQDSSPMARCKEPCQSDIKSGDERTASVKPSTEAPFSILTICSRSFHSHLVKTWRTKACVILIAALTLCIVPRVSLTDSLLGVTVLEGQFQSQSPGSTDHTTTTASFTTPLLFQSWDALQQLSASGNKPGSSNNGHRLIFIGDIHGCIDELRALLAKVEYNRETDHLITTGDMVNKGPDSPAVLDLLRSEKASCVRGNHDHKILRIRSELHAASSGESVVINENSDSRDNEAAVALSLSEIQIHYLQSCPVILHLGEFAGSDLVVVHAGLVPSVPLHDQVADDVMNMRIIDVTTYQPSAKHVAEGSVHWFHLWNRYQAMSIAERQVIARQRQSIDLSTRTVIYGHDAKKGLQLHKYTRGLDSKCVAGGKLTALVLSGHQGEQIFQVDCREYVT